MSRHSTFAFAALFALLTDGIAASTPPTAAGPAYLEVEKPHPDTTWNPEFRDAKLRYPGKSLFNAYGWMLLGTVIPIAASTAIPVDEYTGDASAVAKSLLFFGGFMIGPSAGQIYAGSYGRSALAAAVRTTGFAMGLYALSTISVYCLNCDDSGDSNAGAWIVSGFVVYFAGVIYSMYDSDKAVDRYNAKLRGNGAFGWAPTVVPGTDGSLRTGATAWMRF